MAPSYTREEWFVPGLTQVTESETISFRTCFWHLSKRSSIRIGGHLVRCSNVIGAEDVKRAKEIVMLLRRDPDGEERSDYLQELSSLILCKGKHRAGNRPAVYDYWLSQRSQPQPETTTEIKVEPLPTASTHTQPHCRAEGTTRIKVEPIPRTPTRPRQRQTPRQAESTPEIKTEVKTESLSRAAYTRTRQSSVQPAKQTIDKTSYPLFVKLSHKTPLQAAQHVMHEIQAAITPRKAKSGIVYGFQRPGCDLIKVGFTTRTVDIRMNEFAQNCHYRPKVLFEVPTCNAEKVECLVHRHLYQSKRKEMGMDGLCNEGRGCTSRHEEWFEGLTPTYVESVVMAWTRWMKLEPYDENRVLKSVWAEAARTFDLNASGDIWIEWTRMTPVKKEDPSDNPVDLKTVLEVLVRLRSMLGESRSVPMLARHRNMSYYSSTMPIGVTA
jgi:hypothetical protein